MAEALPGSSPCSRASARVAGVVRTSSSVAAMPGPSSPSAWRCCPPFGTCPFPNPALSFEAGKRSRRWMPWRGWLLGSGQQGKEARVYFGEPKGAAWVEVRQVSGRGSGACKRTRSLVSCHWPSPACFALSLVCCHWQSPACFALKLVCWMTPVSPPVLQLFRGSGDAVYLP